MSRPEEPPPVPPLPCVPAIEPPMIGPPITQGAPLPPMDESHWRFVFHDDPDEAEELDDARPEESSAD